MFASNILFYSFENIFIKFRESNVILCSLALNGFVLLLLSLGIESLILAGSML
jgi:hypothetical protein